MALGLGGLFYYAKRPIEEAKAVIEAICKETGDTELADRLRAVEDSYSDEETAYFCFF